MTIGILGGGQLGRMLALAGQALGLRFRILKNFDYAYGEDAMLAYSNNYEFERFRGEVDVVTYETESVPANLAEWLAQRVPVFPPAQALKVSQDRWDEKNLFHELCVPTVRFVAIASENDLKAAVAEFELPAVLKTRRGGYDGKGQMVLSQREQIASAWEQLGSEPLILEEFIRFERELSILAVRGRAGELAFYPLVENKHRDGMLRWSIAPAPELTEELQQQAEQYAQRIMEHLDYVGVLAIEFFQCNGRLIANEMAPRVHNSGHWTIEGAVTSQFENHLRAIVGWPLGDTSVRGKVVMFNCIGNVPSPEEVLAIPDAHLHRYDKPAAPRRKLGHITVRWPTVQSIPDGSIARLQKLTENFEPLSISQQFDSR